MNHLPHVRVKRKFKGSGMEPNLDVVDIIIVNPLLSITIWKEIHIHLKWKSSIKCRKIQRKEQKNPNSGHPVTIVTADCIWVSLLMVFCFLLCECTKVHICICAMYLYVRFLYFIVLINRSSVHVCFAHTWVSALINSHAEGKGRCLPLVLST